MGGGLFLAMAPGKNVQGCGGPVAPLYLQGIALCFVMRTEVGCSIFAFQRAAIGKLSSIMLCALDCHAMHATMRNALRKVAGLVVASACMLALTGCAEGWDATEAESRDWLPGAYPHLKQVIVLLRTCQPKRPSGYHNIWVDGSNDDEKPHCSFGDDSGIGEIRAELKQSGVLGVSYFPSGSPSKPVESAEFILFRKGLVTSGSSTSLVYTAQPQPCGSWTEGDDGFRVTQSSITPAPCRWFWMHQVG